MKYILNIENAAFSYQNNFLHLFEDNGFMAVSKPRQLNLKGQCVTATSSRKGHPKSAFWKTCVKCIL